MAKGTVEVDSSDQESTDNGFFSLESLTDICGPAGKLRDVCLGRITLGNAMLGILNSFWTHFEKILQIHTT